MTPRHTPGERRLWKGYEPELKVIRFNAQGRRYRPLIYRWELWIAVPFVFACGLVVLWSLLDALYTAAVGK